MTVEAMVRLLLIAAHTDGVLPLPPGAKPLPYLTALSAAQIVRTSNMLASMIMEEMFMRTGDHEPPDRE